MDIFQHLFYDRHKIIPDVIRSHSVGAIEIKRYLIILVKQRTEMSKGIHATEHTPYPSTVELIITVELMLLHFLE